MEHDNAPSVVEAEANLAQGDPNMNGNENHQNGVNHNNNMNGIKEENVNQSKLPPTNSTTSLDEEAAFQVPEKPEDKEKEKEIIREIEQANRKLVKGATWYAILNKWWKDWKDWVQWDIYHSYRQNAPKPGTIDNSPLIETENQESGKEKLEINWKIFTK